MIAKLIDLLLYAWEPKSQAWKMGYDAYYSGTARDRNPFHEPHRRQEWDNGYCGK